MPSIVVVALGEPGVPVICWALADAKTRTVRLNAEINSLQTVMVRLVFTCYPRAALAREDALPCAAVILISSNDVNAKSVVREVTPDCWEPFCLELLCGSKCSVFRHRSRSV